MHFVSAVAAASAPFIFHGQRGGRGPRSNHGVWWARRRLVLATMAIIIVIATMEIIVCKGIVATPSLSPRALLLDVNVICIYCFCAFVCEK